MDSDLRELERVIGTTLEHHEHISILEAGCGSMSRIRLRQTARLIGIDISQKQLERNTELHEKILGDLETYPLALNTYDMIICWDVLEHLSHPGKALRNFSRAVAEGGIIVLASPNVMTLRGFATKFTPHWFHVWFYRNIYGIKDAGKDDNCPFKSYHRFAIAPRALLSYAKNEGLSVEFWKTYDFDEVQKFNPILSTAWGIANAAASILSFGRIQNDSHKAFMMVLRKPGSPKRPAAQGESARRELSDGVK